MNWTWHENRLWWVADDVSASVLLPTRLTRAREPDDDTGVQAACPLGLELYHHTDNRLLVAVPTSSDAPPSPRWTARGMTEACTFALELVRAVRWLHTNGVTLNWYKSVNEAPRALTELIASCTDTMGRARATKPVPNLTGATFGAPPTGVGKRAIPGRYAWLWGGSWRRAFVRAVNAAHPTHLPDWHAVLRLIYYHRTAVRLPEKRRRDGEWLVDHAERTEWQLARGKWLRTAFVARDSHILHWSLGWAGYRAWLSRLDAAFPAPGSPSPAA